MTVTKLTLRDNEDRKIDILVTYWAATKDGIRVVSLEKDHIFISDKDYILWAVKDIEMDPFDLMVF